ncbi:hypothetical protein COCC4DRAFT_148206 [Bipolaris maydis ATCC 48331]|uniref:Uncharacterized protein n=2 Tax=Cochliobolus heterostrophus TaxID=5016 RepID=M2UV36_COCH5|nr:uncharacterized protein COCC4DRAFT_148206 [Bipolaris maydis ATCC 48331]EMD97406.1 hypothetical protein COCHEDRAFT_1164277 [Bipolaris maydis C5]ENI01453.1 hypothetical protein COCC4DRAFT_148206 [Bipolaris maydis ATCC 48331]
MVQLSAQTTMRSHNQTFRRCQMKRLEEPQSLSHYTMTSKECHDTSSCSARSIQNARPRRKCPVLQ